jgi:K+-transporting ATPase KdpF subunit
MLARDGRNGGRLRQVGKGHAMSSMHVLGSVVSLCLLVYLVAALLQPEKFS